MFLELNNISRKTDFLQILLKIKKATILRPINAEASNFQLRLQFMVAFRNWYFIANFATLLLFSTASI